MYSANEQCVHRLFQCCTFQKIALNLIPFHLLPYGRTLGLCYCYAPALPSRISRIVIGLNLVPSARLKTPVGCNTSKSVSGGYCEGLMKFTSAEKNYCEDTHADKKNEIRISSKS